MEEIKKVIISIKYQILQKAILVNMFVSEKSKGFYRKKKFRKNL